ncbi:MAG: hypothetical protein C4293_20530 [Nitrospiraceae bacterium]
MKTMNAGTCNPLAIRRRLATVFPDTFLLAKRCKCRLHIAGPEENPRSLILGVEPCARCRRYAWYLRRAGLTTASRAA